MDPAAGDAPSDATGESAVDETLPVSDETLPVSDDPGVDLDAIAAELAAVEAAMERLEAGAYWTDDVTGEPLPDEVHAADPTARRKPPAAAAPVPDDPQ